ncbi:porin PorA family protein [Candidatus Nitrosotalea bavarica]|uniref:porin PorA family protein n=1 Tax=Candidatus Nitrosotalea bavarica TaxID=1903277 RepID=UPI000C706E1A|nr:porin PorA family protein [Candidatus Nitrosotalea bavarica]
MRISKSTVKRISLLFATTFAVLVIWFGVYIPEFEKIHNDYQVYVEQEGQDQVANGVGTELSQPFHLRESLIQKVIDTKEEFITISSVISGTRNDNGKEIFHSEKEYQVNAYSRTYQDMPTKQFAFKPGVEKHDYEFYHPLVFADSPLVYKKIDNINGLEVYVFQAETHDVDLTDAFPKYDGVRVLSDTVSTFWIEPITGQMIKFEKSWDDHQVINNKKISPMEKGWKKTTDYSVFILSQTAKTKIDNINFNKSVIPAFLVSMTIGLNIIFILRSRLKLSKEIMLKNEKLVAIGNLAARVSHDLRNPLSVIKAEVDIMALRGPKDEKSIARINRLKRAIDRMDRQINGILDFIREKPLTSEWMSSRLLIESVLRTINIPYGVQIVVPKQDVQIFGDVAQLETVLSNIITNAIQATGDTGKIIISTEDKQDLTMLGVSDSGPGIPENDLAKIFEPLFTTKQRGTGLGLSSCQTIIENHGGKIMVKNNPTTFTVQLPKVKQEFEKLVING